jgi:hypothetical protein
LFAIIAAIIFAIMAIMDLANANLGDVLTPGFLQILGFLCISLHLAGIGSGWRRGWRGRRPGRG